MHFKFQEFENNKSGHRKLFAFSRALKLPWKAHRNNIQSTRQLNIPSFYSPDRPLFFPCICTGSIKYIHQECLTQWMRYSRKEYCELCGHKFSFTPIYSPDMPRVLPLRVVAGGLVSSIATAVKYWLHYTLVAGKSLNCFVVSSLN